MVSGSVDGMGIREAIQKQAASVGSEKCLGLCAHRAIWVFTLKWKLLER